MESINRTWVVKIRHNRCLRILYLSDVRRRSQKGDTIADHFLYDWTLLPFWFILMYFWDKERKRHKRWCLYGVWVHSLLKVRWRWWESSARRLSSILILESVSYHLLSLLKIKRFFYWIRFRLASLNEQSLFLSFGSSRIFKSLSFYWSFT